MDNLNKEFNIFQRNARKLVIIPILAGPASVVFIRLIQTDPLAMGFYRLGFSVLIFAVPVILGGHKGFKGLTRKDYLCCVISGFFLFCHFFCWFTAVKNTSIASAIVLCSFHPLVILFFTYVFMKQKVSIKAVIGILIALAGGAVIAGVNQTLEGNYIMGDIAAFMAAVLFGGYFIMGQIMRAKIPTLNYVFIVFGSCFLFFTIAMFLTGTPFTGYSSQDYLWILVMTLVCQVIAHTMYNWCVGYVPSLYISVFASVETVVAVLYGIIFFREIPAFLQCVGAAIAISGLLYYNLNSQVTPKEENEGSTHGI